MFVWLIVIAVTAGFILPIVSVPTQASGHLGPVPPAQTFEATDNIDVWDRSIFTLRADPSNAPVLVPNAFINLVDKNKNQQPLGKEELAVYDESNTITLDFNDSRGNSDAFNSGATVELIRAHLDSDANVTARSFSGAIDLLTANNVNDNATFKEIDPAATIGPGGFGSFTDTVDGPGEGPGEYVYFLAINESGEPGFEVSSGDISLTGNVTIIGVEAILVRSGQPDINPDRRTVVRNNPARFTIRDSGVSGPPNDVTYALVLYNDQTFRDSQITVEATTDIDRNFDISNDAEISSNIGSVNGVANIEDGRTIRGVTLQDGKTSGSFGVLDIVDFIADNTGTSAPSVSGGPTTLDASIHSFQADPNPSGNEKLVVDTFGNWTGVEPQSQIRNYRWIYIAATNDTQVFSVETGRLTIHNRSVAGGPGVGGGGGGGGGRAPSSQARVSRVGPNRANANVPNAQANAPFTIAIPGLAEDDDPDPNAVVLDELTVTPRRSGSFDFGFSKRQNPPPGSPSLDRGNRPWSSIRYFEITHSLQNRDIAAVTIRFRVSKQLLESLGQDRRNVALFRLNQRRWGPVQTQVVGQTDTHYVFEATPPGLSVFSVGVLNPRFAVTQASLDTEQLRVGESARIAAVIENTGDGSGTFTAELTVDGSVVDAVDVTVEAGETERVTFDRTFAEAGTYSVAVSGMAAGRLEVREATETEPTVAVTSPGPPEERAPGAPEGRGQGQRIIGEISAFNVAIVGAIAVIILAFLVLAYRNWE
ncbi:MAG: PGF-pre-PGF domain-containing protein [Halobacteriales archaeon]|nr:PGF-pre-PGF domain-containing protein [Halobacteriales archaeon]